MIEHTPEGIWRGQILEPETRAVTVNIARAGAVPSHTVYGILNTVLVPKLVRQDHIIMSRMLGDADQVVGAGIGGMKIGGDVDGASCSSRSHGPTGSSLSMALDTYKKKVPGTPPARSSRDQLRAPFHSGAGDPGETLKAGPPRSDRNPARGGVESRPGQVTARTSPRRRWPWRSERSNDTGCSPG